MARSRLPNQPSVRMTSRLITAQELSPGAKDHVKRSLDLCLPEGPRRLVQEDRPETQEGSTTARSPRGARDRASPRLARPRPFPPGSVTDRLMATGSDHRAKVVARLADRAEDRT